MIPIISRHRVEIEVESEVRAFLVNEQAFPAEVLIGIDDLIGGNGPKSSLCNWIKRRSTTSC